ncbi:uncharacterized protein TNCV_1046891 [Trichonephila clavipes]|nr:uncharacterized protein TNCV_1046891 [Trichonephila clavipes]
MGVVELNIRIRDFKKPCLFHVLANLEYPCILGIDFIGGSNIILDFDRKSLAIQESQVEDIKVDDWNLCVDFPETKLNVVANVLDNDTIEKICDGITDGTEFAVGYIERLFEEARRNQETKHENWKKYYNRRRRGVQIKVNDWVLVATHPLSLATRKIVANFKPKFEGPYRVLDVKNNNVVIWKAGKRLTINVDQVRIYRHRKCDETEIGTGSPDNGSLRDESSGFDRVQRRSNDSRDGKKKGSEVKRELEEKWLGFRNNQGEKHTNETNKCRPLMRLIPISWYEKDRVIKRGKRNDYFIREHINLGREDQKGRPRIGKREESRPTIERKEKQGVPVRSRKGRGRNDSPYIEERTRSRNKNARRGVDQQPQDQERRGTWTKKPLSLEVLIGNANCKS